MHRVRISIIAAVAAAAFAASAQAETSQASKPDLSGVWVLDVESSDDTESQVIGGAGENTSRGAKRLERDRLVNRLIQLARAIGEIEIEQSERDLKIFDEADNLRIYYLDGKKHKRQTPWGAELEAVATWEGPQIVVRSKGKNLGEVDEIYGMEGRRLVFIVHIRHPEFANEVVIRNYYNRLSDSE